MWAELQAPLAFALVERWEDVVESLLVASATAVVAHWQANEAAGLLMHQALHDYYVEEMAAVGRSVVECADMATAEVACDQAMGNAPGGTAAAA